MAQPHAIIIDDNIQNLGVLSRLLSRQGVQCTEISNPKRLDSVLQDRPTADIVFLDLEMPGLDGYQILEKLKGDARFSSTPIVAYTVHVSEIGVAHQQGFDGFIGKPLDPSKFPDQLNRILNGEPVWETA